MTSTKINKKYTSLSKINYLIFGDSTLNRENNNKTPIISGGNDDDSRMISFFSKSFLINTRIIEFMILNYCYKTKYIVNYIMYYLYGLTNRILVMDSGYYEAVKYTKY